MQENSEQETKIGQRNVRAAILRTTIRFALVILFVVLVNFGLNWVLGQFQTIDTPGAQLMLTGILLLSLLLYAVLMAIPFVPGVEIGLSLLMMQGSSIAPYVFLATFLGLTLAYLIGRFMPYRPLHNLFSDLGLKSACNLLERIHPLSKEERLDLMCQNLPSWLREPLVRFRYLTVALALNVPGNSFVGGGGGIALVAGLSRTFDTRLILLCFALAVAPVPIAVFFFGVDIAGLAK